MITVQGDFPRASFGLFMAVCSTQTPQCLQQMSGSVHCKHTSQYFVTRAKVELSQLEKEVNSSVEL